MKLHEHPAVKDGTIDAYAAFSGLRENEMIRLRNAHPNAEILVRYRSLAGDFRLVMTVAEFPKGNGANKHANLMNVRDVFLIVPNENEPGYTTAAPPPKADPQPCLYADALGACHDPGKPGLYGYCERHARHGSDLAQAAYARLFRH